MKSHQKGKFFAGGILYNPETREVLLQKRDAKAEVNPDKWGFFGGLGEENETPTETLLRELQEELGVSVDQKDIKPLCDYFVPARGVRQFVFYVPFRRRKEEMRLGEGADFDWVSVDDALKLDLTKHTRQDLLTFKEKIAQNA